MYVIPIVLYIYIFFSAVELMNFAFIGNEEKRK